MIVLTARDAPTDKVDLLELGANDYLVKPVDPRELLARVAVQLRQNYDQTFMVGLMEVSTAQQRVWLLGREVILTQTEFDVLMALMDQPGKVYSRGQLSQRIWGASLPQESNVLDVHIGHLRSKFQAAGFDPVRTVRSVGYGLRLDELHGTALQS